MISVKLQVQKIGTPPLQRLESFESFSIPFVQEEIIALANVVKDRMIQIISGRKLHQNRGKSQLENNIRVEIIVQAKNSLVVGIGNISELNNIAPYWKRLNEGFTPPTTGKKVPLGSFTPGEAPDSAKSGGVWNIGDLYFTFVDKKLHKSVKPFSYIDIAETEGYRAFISIQKRIENLVRK